MTVPLSKEVKKKRKLARKQQKAKSKTVKTIKQPKPEEPKTGDPAAAVNLCDDCAYEFGECDGWPKFASDLEEGLTGAAADRVVKCAAFFPVEKMPTSDNPPQDGGPGAAVMPFEEALTRLDEFGKSLLIARAAEIRAEAEKRIGPEGKPSADVLVEIVQEIIQKEGGPTSGLLSEEPAEEPPASPPADPTEPDVLEERRARVARLQADVADDLGTCPACNQPLKRTAYNRYVDAVRCVNGRCRAYRTIVRTIAGRGR